MCPISNGRAKCCKAAENRAFTEENNGVVCVPDVLESRRQVSAFRQRGQREPARKNSRRARRLATEAGLLLAVCD
jgi:hypothetical protein